MVTHAHQHIPMPNPTIPNYSPFYRHIYGGIARDVEVTLEGFSRIFGRPVSAIEILPVNMKIFDENDGSFEILGYKIRESRGNRTKYCITMINHDRVA